MGRRRRLPASIQPRPIAALRARLEARRAEIEQALLTRVYGIADPSDVGDLAYLDGLRAAASNALDFALAALEDADGSPLPPSLLSQARLAARNGVGVDTVLRRYTAGHALLVDFLIEEVEHAGNLSPSELRRLLAASSSTFDRLLAAVSEEHARELQGRLDHSQERRLAERVERLLAGDLIDPNVLSYDLDAWHIALVGSGPGSEQAVRELAAGLDRRSLVVRQKAGDVVWVWLGGRSLMSSAELADIAKALPDRLKFAIGEPCEGLAGWRLSHRQAVAAFPVAQRSEESVTRYSDVALLASTMGNDILLATLKRLYLEPLEQNRDGGATARQTLRAYFATGGNISSAAAILDASRNTVTSRLRAIEEDIGRPLASCAAELVVALGLETLTTA